MIAQTLAIGHPQRVRSLTSIMSTTGNPDLPPPTPQAMAVLLSPPPADRDAVIEHAVRVFRTIGSPGFPFDEEFIRRRATRSYERGFAPMGVVRQMVAILASGSRTEALGSVKAPTLIIHGADDPLVPLAGGRDTAAAIPHAELMVIEGMGHDMPRAIWPRLIDAIANLWLSVPVSLDPKRSVVPANAGIQAYGLCDDFRRAATSAPIARAEPSELMEKPITWIPAFAGMTLGRGVASNGLTPLPPLR